MTSLRAGQIARTRHGDEKPDIVLLPHLSAGELVAVSLISTEHLLEHLPRILERMLAYSVAAPYRGTAPEEASSGRGSALTQRQLSIIAHMAQGCTNSEIARRICFSESTVRMESISIYRKLQVRGRKEAVQKACDLGLLDADAVSLNLVPA